MIQKGKKIWMDGRLLDWDSAQVHVLTHTLHYGLGVFEGIRCYETPRGPAVFRLREHLERLLRSAHIFMLQVPYSLQELQEAVLQTIRANELKECYIRPIVFVGTGAMGLYAVDNPVHVAIAVWPWGAYLGAEGLKKGIRVKVSSFVRGHPNSYMFRAKVCGYYVNSQLAKREAIACGFDEALLLDADGFVSEGSGENIFMVRQGVLRSTPLTTILEGITRDSVITFARDEGIPFEEARFSRDELYIAEEAFFTGTAAEITPIRELDGRAIGQGCPGPITRRLQELFFQTVRGQNERYGHWLTYL
jgi:branched-chain amino acid aminotransferase